MPRYELPTVRIVDPDDPTRSRVINASEFDPGAHRRWTDLPAAPAPGDEPATAAGVEATRKAATRRGPLRGTAADGR